MAFVVYPRMEGDMITYLEQQTHGMIAETELALFVRSAVRALWTLHIDLKIAHNDIKPENFLFRRGRHGRLDFRLCDFGLASTEVGALLPGRVHARNHKVIGTPKFCAPEMINGELVTNASVEELARADMWSFGMTLYYVLTLGRCGLPFRISRDQYLDRLSQRQKMSAADYDCELKYLFMKRARVIHRMPMFHQLCYRIIARLLCFDPKKRMTVVGVARLIGE